MPAKGVEVGAVSCPVTVPFGQRVCPDPVHPQILVATVTVSSLAESCVIFCLLSYLPDLASKGLTR